MNYLILWKDIRLFVGSHSRPVIEHNQPVIQFIVAPNGKFSTRVQQTDEWMYKQGLLIKPNYPHQCDATDVPIISMDIEPDSVLGTWILTNVFEKDPLLDYPSEKYNPIDFELFNHLLDTKNWNSLYVYFKEIFRLADKSQINHKDKRITLNPQRCY